MFRLVFTLTAILAWGASVARAEDFRGSIPAEMAEAAKQILDVMDGEKQQTVEIGQFIPVGANPANGGPGLRLELIRALESLKKGVVQDQALLAVNGKFLIVDDPDDLGSSPERRFQVERITLTIDDKSTGDSIKSVKLFIRRLRDIAAIEGVNVSLGPNDDARKQGQDIRGGLNNPQAVVEGARIRSRQDSPFALELRAKPLATPKEVAQPRPAALEKGHAFVRIDKGELYELVFHNGARHEVALSITIDGIDTFTFSDDRDPKTDAPAFSHWLVSPGQTLVLPGWHKTNDPKRDDNFLSFLVTEYGQGAGSKFPTKSQGQIGVITVQISKSHQPRSGQAKSGAETGFGPPVKGELEAVERQIDPPLDFITVRYLR